MRKFGEQEEEGHEVGQPEVVVGDGSVLRRGDVALVHVASGLTI